MNRLGERLGGECDARHLAPDTRRHAAALGGGSGGGAVDERPSRTAWFSRGRGLSRGSRASDGDSHLTILTREPLAYLLSILTRDPQEREEVDKWSGKATFRCFIQQTRYKRVQQDGFIFWEGEHADESVRMDKDRDLEEIYTVDVFGEIATSLYSFDRASLLKIPAHVARVTHLIIFACDLAVASLFLLHVATCGQCDLRSNAGPTCWRPTRARWT